MALPWRLHRCWTCRAIRAGAVAWKGRAKIHGWRADRRRQGARHPGRGSCGCRFPRCRRQALLRLRCGDGGTRLRIGRPLRAQPARSACAAVRGRRGGRRRRRDAGVHRSCRHPVDRACRPAARPAARATGLRWRHRERLQRDRGTDAPRRRRQPERCGDPGAERRRRHRHDVERLSAAACLRRSSAAVSPWRRSTRPCAGYWRSSSAWACSSSRISAAPPPRVPRRAVPGASWHARSAPARIVMLKNRDAACAAGALRAPPRRHRAAGGRCGRDGRPLVTRRRSCDPCERPGRSCARLPDREILHAPGVAIQSDETSASMRRWRCATPPMRSCCAWAKRRT